MKRFWTVFAIVSTGCGIAAAFILWCSSILNEQIIAERIVAELKRRNALTKSPSYHDGVRDGYRQALSYARDSDAIKGPLTIESGGTMSNSYIVIVTVDGPGIVIKSDLGRTGCTQLSGNIIDVRSATETQAIKLE